MSEAMVTATATFQFLRDLDLYRQEKPYHFDGPLAPEHESRRTNLEYESKPVLVQDGRQNIERFTIQKQGFKLIKHKTGTKINDGTYPSKAVVDEYLNEVVEVMKQEFDGSKVIVFDYAVRTLTPSLVVLSSINF